MTTRFESRTLKKQGTLWLHSTKFQRTGNLYLHVLAACGLNPPPPKKKEEIKKKGNWSAYLEICCVTAKKYNALLKIM